MDASLPASNARLGERWLELVILLIGQAMGSSAISIVSVAAPAISRDLQISDGVLQLSVSGYSLAYTALLVTGARLGDWDHRRLFLFGAGLFILAGLASGLAPGPAVLVLGQLLQGAGAAMLIPQVLALIQIRFVEAARSRAVGLYSMTLGFGVAIGLLLGGLLISANPAGLSWRLVFLINIPIGLLLLLVGWLWLPHGGVADHRPVDKWGTLVFTTAILLLVVPLAFGSSAGWPRWTWAALIAGLATLGTFAIVERGVVRRGVQPLLDLGLLRLPSVPIGLFVVFATMGGYGTLVYTMSALMQKGLGYGVLRSGVIFSAYATGFGLVNLTWSMLPKRWHRWISPAAVTILCLAEATLGVILRFGFPIVVVVPLLAMAGAGHGAGFGALVARITSHLPSRYASAASGLINITFQFAILVGIAAVGGAYLSAVHGDGLAGYRQAMSTVLFVLAAVSAIAVVCTSVVSLRLPDTPSAANSLDDR